MCDGERAETLSNLSSFAARESARDVARIVYFKML